MTLGDLARACPCGTGQDYDRCCGPLHRGERLAATAVELMRSRYAAYARDVPDHLFRSWHPRTRPSEPAPDPATTWTSLEVLATTGGGPADEAGTVEFRAHFRTPSGAGSLHELSRFVRRAGRWVYLDGDVR